mmetsp:Transcript_14271/g.34153  ORF Transcript_14271/g.34153 Transcript_14271/m.34153 type:complete len:261 (-) Transcript_14271:29-811(-)
MQRSGHLAKDKLVGVSKEGDPPEETQGLVVLGHFEVGKNPPEGLLIQPPEGTEPRDGHDVGGSRTVIQQSQLPERPAGSGRSDLLAVDDELDHPGLQNIKVIPDGGVSLLDDSLSPLGPELVKGADQDLFFSGGKMLEHEIVFEGYRDEGRLLFRLVVDGGRIPLVEPLQRGGEDVPKAAGALPCLLGALLKLGVQAVMVRVVAVAAEDVPKVDESGGISDCVHGLGKGLLDGTGAGPVVGLVTSICAVGAKKAVAHTSE